MYCPQCGENQNSGNLRFCSRCGMPIDLVAEVVANGGTLPQLQELYKKNSSLFTRKNGIFFSIFWFILFVPFGAAFWGVLDVSELSGISAVFGVFSSLLILLFSLFFLGSPNETTQNQMLAQKRQMNQPPLDGQKVNNNALPPQQSQTAQDYVTPQAGMWKAPDTGDLASPGSVTEGTTKLLSKEEQQEQEQTKYLDRNN